MQSHIESSFFSVGFNKNKILSLLLVASIAIAAIPYARGLGNPETPPGAAADHWVAMGDAAGFVITDSAKDVRRGLRTDSNTVRGYFKVSPRPNLDASRPNSRNRSLSNTARPIGPNPAQRFPRGSVYKALRAKPRKRRRSDSLTQHK
jgi:hypothetical protein